MATSFESIKLNFQSSAYSTAVTQLESKMKELESARSEYDQRRSEIPQFWDGDARDEAYEVIGQNIENVKTAYKAVEENMRPSRKQTTRATRSRLRPSRSWKMPASRCRVCSSPDGILSKPRAAGTAQ